MQSHASTIFRKTHGGSPVGFALTQEFRSAGWPLPCNYSYQQRYEFYADGRFRMIAASIGSGCGDDGTYRPVLRMEPAGDDWTAAAWDGSAWKAWDTEQWTQQKPDTPYTKEGYELRLTRADGTGFYVEPGRGQFGDGGRGDFAFSYVTRRDPAKDEGESDLITIGPCCNTDYKQGPEKFIEPMPEPIANAPIVFWYVAQLKNDDTPGPSIAGHAMRCRWACMNRKPSRAMPGRCWCRWGRKVKRQTEEILTHDV